MELIKERIPSKREIWLIFVICMIPVHIWAYAIFFYDVPGYIIRMSFPEMLRVLAYIQLVALAESIFFSIGILFINFTLPTRLFRAKLLPSATVLMLITFIWFVGLHYQPQILENLGLNEQPCQFCNLIWIISYIIVLLGFLILIQRKPGFEKIIGKVPEYLSLLAIVYLAIDVFGMVMLVLYYIG